MVVAPHTESFSRSPQRPEFGGKVAQSFISTSAEYAMLSQKYVIRSSLSGLERNRQGVENLREGNKQFAKTWTDVRKPIRSVTADYTKYLHPASLTPSKWGPKTEKAAKPTLTLHVTVSNAAIASNKSNPTMTLVYKTVRRLHPRAHRGRSQWEARRKPHPEVSLPLIQR